MIPGFLFFALCMALALKLSLRPPVEGRLEGVCDFVAEKIYLPRKTVGPWTDECHARVRSLASAASVAERIETFNDIFAKLRSSHLVMYTPTEATKLWTGESKETGIESFFVDGELVIRKVHSLSPAKRAGLQFGDVIKAVNGADADPETAESASGNYLIERRGKTLKLTIEPASFVRDEELRVEKLAKNAAVLRVPSFRAEYFAEDAWKKTAESLKSERHIILDLRGNLGGNFVAGLRFLSPFLCAPTEVGELIKPQSTGTSLTILPDDLNDETQIDIVNGAKRVKLQSFTGYPCLKAAIDVLVDAETASTAEMVAQALADFRHAKVRGSMSAGQLLVGLWYPVPEVGDGVKISIPEAVYETAAGHRIEGPGVKLDEVLYYHLEDFQSGRDSWIKTVSGRNVTE